MVDAVNEAGMVCLQSCYWLSVNVLRQCRCQQTETLRYQVSRVECAVATATVVVW